MSEFIAGAKLSIVVGSVLGGLLSMSFIQMCAKKRFIAVASGTAMSYELGEPVSAWVGLPPEPTGFLIGLFGIAICQLIFESLKKSDLSIKFSDIMDFFRSGRG